jgi:hypothetical protein
MRGGEIAIRALWEALLDGSKLRRVPPPHLLKEPIRFLAASAKGLNAGARMRTSSKKGGYSCEQFVSACDVG